MITFISFVALTSFLFGVFVGFKGAFAIAKLQASLTNLGLRITNAGLRAQLFFRSLLLIALLSLTTVLSFASFF